MADYHANLFRERHHIEVKRIDFRSAISVIEQHKIFEQSEFRFDEIVGYTPKSAKDLNERKGGVQSVAHHEGRQIEQQNQ